MIKYPGGELAFWTILYILAGTFISYLSFAEGNVILGAVFAVLPVACLLIWFDIRPAKWLVVAYLAIATVGAIGIMVTKGFSVSMAVRGALAAWGAVQFAIWQGGPNSDSP